MKKQLFLWAHHVHPLFLACYDQTLFSGIKDGCQAFLHFPYLMQMIWGWANCDEAGGGNRDGKQADIVENAEIVLSVNDRAFGAVFCVDLVVGAEHVSTKSFYTQILHLYQRQEIINWQYSMIFGCPKSFLQWILTSFKIPLSIHILKNKPPKQSTGCKL